MDDIRSYFDASSSKSTPTDVCSTDTESDSDTDHLQPKKLCTASIQRRDKCRPQASKRNYNKNWEKKFTWLEYSEDHQGVFCKVCKKRGVSLERTGGAWITKPFNNWKKALEKMRAHSQSEVHIQSCAAEADAATALKGGSIVQLIQSVTDQQKMKNRMAIKALLRCTHFLTRRHIAHTTNFEGLVNLIESCGSEYLKAFKESAGKNATYTSTDSVVGFVEALGTWVERSLLKQVQQAQFYSIMADECTDITTVEELSIFFRWVNDGVAVEHFLGILPLKKADAVTIHSTLIKFLNEKEIQLGKLVGMGFDGAATFSGKHKGVQSLLKRNSPHALYVHCHCHLLQLACVQAANNTAGIKHVYTTLTSLWKFFHYSPKRTERLKEIQHVINLPELKMIKPSDTRWLSHERCVKAVKESYSALVYALNDIYEESHEPEALGLSKVLCKLQTIAAVHLLDYVLPQVAKLSKTLQTEKLEITAISGLVESVLHSLDDAVLPSANWVLGLIDLKGEIEEATGLKLSTTDITSFQKNAVESLKI